MSSHESSPTDKLTPTAGDYEGESPTAAPPPTTPQKIYSPAKRSMKDFVDHDLWTSDEEDSTDDVRKKKQKRTKKIEKEENKNLLEEHLDDDNHPFSFRCLKGYEKINCRNACFPGLDWKMDCWDLSVSAVLLVSASGAALH